MLFLSADGNFRLQRKHKQDDPDDVALNGGNAYFVDADPYKVYVGHVDDCDDVCDSQPPSLLNNVTIVTKAVHMCASSSSSPSKYHQVQECCHQRHCCYPMRKAWLLQSSGYG